MEERHVCHDCRAIEGQLHEPSCDMERCPFCGGQLISCDCIYIMLNLFDAEKYGMDTYNLPPDIYNNGPTEEQSKEWDEILEKKGRVPYIVFPNMCARCGKLWPEMFRVPDEDWRHYVPIMHQDKMLCWDCYNTIKGWIDESNA